MKKILILSVTAGNGHNSCAKSMKRKLENMGEEVEVEIVDLLKSFSTKNRAWIADKGYNIAVSKLLPIYNYFYNQCKKKDPNKRYTCSAMQVAKTTLDGLLAKILEYKPDVIFCTHFYAGAALTALKKVVDLPCKTFITSLDYVNSPFWEACVGVDYFNVPNEDFVKENISEGFNKEQILTYGLPVDERTLVATEKKLARKELSLDENLFTIMVMFGGGFWKGGFKIFKNILDVVEDRNVQVVMINGKNQKDFDKIAKMKFKDNLKIVNVGFTDKIPLYMSASDMIVNKCGGLSSTEAINQGLPMLTIEKLPAQEKFNLEYLKGKNVLISFKNKKELKAGLFKIMDNSDFRNEMLKGLTELKRNAVEKLAIMMLEQEMADYSEILAKNLDFKAVKKEACKALKQADKQERKKTKEKK